MDTAVEKTVTDEEGVAPFTIADDAGEEAVGWANELPEDALKEAMKNIKLISRRRNEMIIMCPKEDLKALGSLAVPIAKQLNVTLTWMNEFVVRMHVCDLILARRPLYTLNLHSLMRAPFTHNNTTVGEFNSYGPMFIGLIVVKENPRAPDTPKPVHLPPRFTLTPYDLTVHVPNEAERQLHAHEVVLRTRSLTFDNMFKHGMVEHQTRHVSLDRRLMTVKRMLDFCYTSTLRTQLNMPNVMDVFRCAHLYEVDDLCQVAEQRLRRFLTRVECIGQLAHFVIEYDLHQSALGLKQGVLDRLNASYTAIANTDEWKAMVNHVLTEPNTPRRAALEALLHDAGLTVELEFMELIVQPVGAQPVPEAMEDEAGAEAMEDEAGAEPMAQLALEEELSDDSWVSM